jgi:RNA polymerase sigma-70 factor (TIGR02960 family)
VSADAFEATVASYRRELEVHCYRLLGSLADAEDAVQDTLVRAWGAMDRLDDDSNVRAWLYRIATNRCLTLIERRRRRELPMDLTPGAPVTETAWLEPYPDSRLGPTPAGPEARYESLESMRLAFVAVLQHLPGRQRAALVLRDVLGMPAAEAAEVLDLSVPAVNSALQRARATVSRRPPEAASPPADVERIADAYAVAWERGDTDAIVALLSADVRYAMPPVPEWYAGRDDVREFLVTGPLRERWRFLPARANGQVAFGTYLWDDARHAYVAAGLDLLDFRGTEIVEVVSFLSPAIFGRFGLPDEVA